MKLICRDCGYTRKELPIYEDYGCPICYSIMEKEKEEIYNDTTGMDIVLDNNFITSMTHNIQLFGKEQCFKNIEKIGNAKVRLKYRNYYFKALKEIEEV